MLLPKVGSAGILMSLPGTIIPGPTKGVPPEVAPVVMETPRTAAVVLGSTAVLIPTVVVPAFPAVVVRATPLATSALAVLVVVAVISAAVALAPPSAAPILAVLPASASEISAATCEVPALTTSTPLPLPRRCENQALEFDNRQK